MVVAATLASVRAFAPRLKDGGNKKKVGSLLAFFEAAFGGRRKERRGRKKKPELGPAQKNASCKQIPCFFLGLLSLA